MIKLVGYWPRVSDVIRFPGMFISCDRQGRFNRSWVVSMPGYGLFEKWLSIDIFFYKH